MRDLGQKLNEINGMLGVFQQYWPTFKMQDGQAEAWAYALKDYSREELWESVKQFSTEESRVFAPSISELIGRTDTLREINKRKQSDRLALEAPKKSKSDYEALEEYSFLTSRTAPKKNKDDSEHETRKAFRASPQLRKEKEENLRKDGWIKISIPLAGGKFGYQWVKNINYL